MVRVWDLEERDDSQQGRRQRGTPAKKAKPKNEGLLPNPGPLASNSGLGSRVSFFLDSRSRSFFLL